jgi:peptidoglycan/xylan/chitin deacetylase (PgdA/CDA1 family)
VISPHSQHLNFEKISKSRARIIVLGYHDIAPPGQADSWLQVDTLNFERQLRICRKVGVFIRPEDLFEAGRLHPDRINFLLTFDDGLFNNFHLGLPLLKKYEAPALFFISTWHMQSSEPFWFNRIVGLIQRNRLREVDLRFLGLGHYFFRSHGVTRWNDIQVLLDDIKKFDEGRENVTEAHVSAFLQQQLAAAGVEVKSVTNRPLTENEIKEMQASGLCFFGSHGHRHVIFTHLDDTQLHNELATSRIILENLLQQKIDTIAYPNGNSDERIRQACRTAGYRLGFTVESGLFSRATNFLDIPRHLVGGYDSSLGFIWNLVKIVLGGKKRKSFNFMK